MGQSLKRFLLRSDDIVYAQINSPQTYNDFNYTLISFDFTKGNLRPKKVMFNIVDTIMFQMILNLSYLWYLAFMSF